MKTTKEKSDEIISRHQILDDIYFSKKEAILNSIASVKHTIEVLQSLKLEIIYNGYYEQTPNLETEMEYSIRKQTELLKELESRL